MNSWRMVTASALILCGVVACGLSEPESTNAPIDPETFCPSECQRRIDANCSNMPPDYQQSCEMLCLGRYNVYPQCEAELIEYDRCLVQRTSYQCDENGTMRVVPSGACAAEGMPCMTCTNDMMGCGF